MSSETLADFVRRVRNQKRFSTTDVESRSRRGGNKGISHAYVSKIENGLVESIGAEKIKALARGLDVSEQLLFNVVRGLVIIDHETIPPDILDEARFLFDDKGELTEEDKDDLRRVLRMAKAMIDQRRTERENRL